MWTGLVALALLSGFYFLTRNAGEAQPQGRRGNGVQRAMPVGVDAARSADVDVYVEGLGTVTPMNTVTVRARVEGQLLRVLYREGQMVKAGELLAEIDPRPFQVQLTQAEGQMARDQALLNNARHDLERYRQLYAEDSIARQQVDTQAALVRQYEGTVKSDQGAIDNARLQLSYTRIAAPIAGRTGLRQVDPGNMVRASDANGLVVITQVHPTGVVFSVPETNLPAIMKRLQAGETLPVDAYDREGRMKVSAGALLTVDNLIDTATGTVKLKAQFANEDGALFPNQFVNARMRIDTLRGVTVMPVSAIQRGTPGTFVYVVKPDKTVTVRPVKLGPPAGEQVAVTGGLAPGEHVVVDGADKLREGARVEPVMRAAAPQQPAAPRGAAGQRQGRRPRRGEQ